MSNLAQIIQQYKNDNDSFYNTRFLDNDHSIMEKIAKPTVS